MTMRYLPRAALFSIIVLLVHVGIADAASASVRYVHKNMTANKDMPANALVYPSLASAAADLNPGDTLVIGPGMYRESIMLPQKKWARNQPTIIRSAKPGSVLIMGSDVVTGWKWLPGGLFVKDQWPVNTQQVFVDGVQLTQIGGTIFNGYPNDPANPLAGLHPGVGIWPGRIKGGLNQMADNSFYYDIPAHRLYIRMDGVRSLDDHLVEASTRTHLLFGKDLEGLYVRDLEFRHANTSSVSRAGAITLLGNDIVIDNIKVTLADSVGFNIKGDDVIIKNSVANYCGQMGISVKGKRARVLNNEMDYNNTRGFNKWWGAGGAKFVGNGGLHDSEISGNRALFNNGDGIWFDWLNHNNRIHDNLVAYNKGFGIHYEVSDKAYIYNNYVFGNSQRGIYLPQSSRSLIAHNLVAFNGLEGIAVADNGRRHDSVDFDFVPSGNKIIGNIVLTGTKRIASLSLPKNLAGNISDYNMYITLDVKPAFLRGLSARFAPGLMDMSAWVRSSGQDAHSWQVRLPNLSRIEQQVSEKIVDIDWSPVLDTAINLKVPVDLTPGIMGTPIDAASLPPGPFKER